MEHYLTPFVVAWLALATAVVVLGLTRKVIAYRENDTLHVHEGDAALVAQQQSFAHRLDVIDRWGKILTAAAVVSGIVMAIWFLYQAWMDGSKIPPM
jgi:hypothetical protein